MSSILKPGQIVANIVQETGIEENRIAQVVGKPECGIHQYAVEGEHEHTLQDAPLAAMRTPLRDGFCNGPCRATRTCARRSWHIKRSCLVCIYADISWPR